MRLHVPQSARVHHQTLLSHIARIGQVELPCVRQMSPNCFKYTWVLALLF